MVLKPLEITSLRERAAQAIRAGIITGEIGPGEIYSTPVLAERLGVSATPVREAMLDLANEGLVEPVRNRGFRVVPLTEADLDEIFELRMLLEVPTMVRVADIVDTVPAATVSEFRALADEIEKFAKAGDLVQFLDADRKFHVGLIELLGNRRLAELVGRLRDHSRLYGLRRLDRAALVASAGEHRGILDAIARGDKKNVKTLMQQHLGHTRGIWAGRSEREDGAKGGVPVAATAD
ncbi:MAG: GntR family transcriptional regulator [Gaiellaceae bacterium]